MVLHGCYKGITGMGLHQTHDSAPMLQSNGYSVGE
jgi:hypothetical protein